MSGYPAPVQNYALSNIHAAVESNDTMPQHEHHTLPAPSAYSYESQQQNPTPQSLAASPHQSTPYNGLNMSEHGGEAQQGKQRRGGAGEATGGQRLRKACDSCSARKVKCDESGPPCRACTALDLPCTFERPSRRRGPPNRHAEAIKRRRLESPTATGSYSSPTSPSNAAATLASFSSHAVLNAESICPISILRLLVEDFFTYIHPLTPFPHEPSFRAAFEAREDLNNPSFLALLASMVGLLVASFPRKPRLHLKSQHLEHLFPTSVNLVERCHKVAVEARGAGYLDKDLTVYDAATSYFLGLSAAYTYQLRSTRLYFGETLNILRVLGAHKPRGSAFQDVGTLPATFGGGRGYGPQSPSTDHIQEEIGRRLFWIMVVGVRSMQQLGAGMGELIIPPPTPSEPYPPLPQEVDDEYIYMDRVGPQPVGIVSKLVAFNLGIKVYSTLTPMATMELAYGIEEVFDWNRQRRILAECLRAVKGVLDEIPPELMLQPGTKPGEFESPEMPYYRQVANYPTARSNGHSMEFSASGSHDPRRQLQFEIQKANIYASQLGTRSYIVEKYLNFQETYDRVDKAGTLSSLRSPGPTAAGLESMMPILKEVRSHEDIETTVAEERELIVQDLLKVLASISQVNMEPNGNSFINKIRQIASTLIDAKQTRKGPLAMKAEEYLNKFLDVLMKLERLTPSISRVDSEVGPVDEEEELRNWSDLRDHQMRFAQAGGFMGEL